MTTDSTPRGVRSVPCPTCQAEVGRPCVYRTNGKPGVQSHAARIKKYREVIRRG